ncbi:multidrug effflux MFS transporter [Amaricoccus macauensis]|uniref:multidrug effflux MFS transporter n=1 Tax=Amaricoccus macauensis TaxID=57001 RepID=UPI003C7C3153
MTAHIEGRAFVRLVAILGALTATGPFAIDMYLASFPELARVFDATAAEVQLGLSLFFLGLALGQLLYGPLIDSYGRRGALLAGIGGFTLTSLLLALAPNIESFVILRFFQAVGACAGMIIGRAIISDLFEETEVARVMSLLMLAIGLAPVLAPMTGAYIVAHASWHLIFILLAVIGAGCWIAAFLGLPETLPREERKPFNLGSVLRNYGLVLTNRDFLVPTFGAGFSLAALFTFVAACPFVYMEVFGASPQLFGWLFALNAIGMIGLSQLNRLFLSYYQLRHVLIAASIVTAVAGLALLGMAGTDSLTVVVILAFFCLAPIPMSSANSVAISLKAASGLTGSASAIVGVVQFGFGAVVSGMVGMLQDGTAYPMAGIMAVCACAALVIFALGLVKKL